MKKIQKIDGKEIDNEVQGKPLEDAVKIVFYRVINKINELVEAYNEPKKK